MYKTSANQNDPQRKVKIGDKVVGIIINGHFEKRVRLSRHLSLKVPGLAMDMDVLEFLDCLE